MKRITRVRPQRHEVLLPPDSLRHFASEDHPWHETPEQVAEGIALGRDRARLLRWVRKVLGQRLTERERRCIELCYFQGMSHREAAAATGTNASSVCRAVRRGLRRLKAAAAEGTVRPPMPRGGRRR